MAKSDIVQFTEGAADEIGRTVREVTRRMMNDQPQRQRWFQRAGSGGTCTGRYDMRIYWAPTGGTVSMTLTYNSVPETITFDWDFTAAEVKSEIDSHSEYVAAGVTCEVDSVAGFPHSNVVVLLPKGSALNGITQSLTRRVNGYEPEFRIDICCS